MWTAPSHPEGVVQPSCNGAKRWPANTPEKKHLVASQVIVTQYNAAFKRVYSRVH